MKFKKLSSLLIASAFVIGLLNTPAYAEGEHPMDHGTSSDASVSEEVDVTDTDNNISTRFFMFVPSAPVSSDIPEMGDAGMDPDKVFTLTICVGLAYLAIDHYANSVPQDCKNP